MNQVKRYGPLRAKTFAGRVAEHHRNLKDFVKRAQTGQIVCISDLMANRDRLVTEQADLRRQARATKEGDQLRTIRERR
jgi:hypothetical protein